MNAAPSNNESLPRLTWAYPWVLVAMLGVLTACQQQNEGPAETAGRQVDQAVENATEKVEETTEAVGEQIEEAGQKLQEAADSK